MVVALLGILFVAGVAFLSTVRFKANQVRSVQDDRVLVELTETTAREIRVQLARSFLGSNRIPWDSDDADPLNPNIPADRYGDLFGFHPLAASIEPHPDPSTLGEPVYYQFSNLTKAILRIPADQPCTPGVSNPPGPGQHDAFVNPDPLAFGGLLGANWADADGDGVPDSEFWRLPAEAVPLSLRKQAQSLLNDPDADFSGLGVGTNPPPAAPTDFDPTMLGDPSDVWLALRVVPHGGMLDLANAHPAMISYVTGIDPLTTPLDPTSYSPMVEQQLRYRGMLSRRHVNSDEPYPLPAPLVNLFTRDSGGVHVDQWWPLSIADAMSPDFAMFVGWTDDNITNAQYDLRHISTITSHDDVLRRGSNVVLPPANFALASYPNIDPTTGMTAAPAGPYAAMLAGRMQLSLPWIENQLLNGALNTNDPGVGGVDSIASDPNDPMAHPNAGLAVQLIIESFSLMLKSVDDVMVPNLDGSVGTPTTLDIERDRAIQAAMLAANLIDFADSDEEPCRLTAMWGPSNVTGASPGNEVDEDGNGLADWTVFGVERQPFISEIYSQVSGPALNEFVIAIELQNPYLTDLPAMNAADTYYLQVNADPPVALQMLPTAEDLKVYVQDQGGALTGLTSHEAFLTPVSTNPLMPGDAVTLIRRVVYNGVPIDIIVDQFPIPSSFPPPALASGPTAFGTSQREAPLTATAPPTPPDGRNWMVAMPWTNHDHARLQNYPALMTPPEVPTLEARNNVSIASAKPIQVLLDGSGDLSLAFPTTGSLLLLLDRSHLVSAAGVSLPFNAQLLSTVFDDFGDADGDQSVVEPIDANGDDVPDSWDTDMDGKPDADANGDGVPDSIERIDIGRIPVFDQARKAQSSAGIIERIDQGGTANTAVRAGSDDVQLAMVGTTTLAGQQIIGPGTDGVLQSVPNDSDGDGIPEPLADPATDQYDGYAPDYRLDVPWGQLVYDFFTATPLTHTRPAYNTAMAPVDLYPNIDADGVRASGRVNINAATWQVIAGVPMLNQIGEAPPGQPTLPAALSVANIGNVDLNGDGVPNDYLAGPDGTSTSVTMTPPTGAPVNMLVVGERLARGAVAYRERRNVAVRTGLNTIDGYNLGYGSARSGAVNAEGRAVRSGPGMLTVGELANVATPPDYLVGSAPPEPWMPPTIAAGDHRRYQIDAGRYDAANFAAPNAATDTYLHAVARLVAITDWLTTRSHTFTVYGVLRGNGSNAATDARAVRFQETIDRLPTVLGGDPQRIGELIIEPYKN